MNLREHRHILLWTVKTLHGVYLNNERKQHEFTRGQGIWTVLQLNCSVLCGPYQSQNPKNPNHTAEKMGKVPETQRIGRTIGQNPETQQFGGTICGTRPNSAAEMGGLNMVRLQCPHWALAAPAPRLSSPSVHHANSWRVR